MIKIKDLSIYLKNNGFIYLKKPKRVISLYKAIYYMLNGEVIIRLSIVNNQIEITFFSVYQKLSDSFWLYEIDEYDFGNTYVFSEILHNTLEMINFLETKMAKIKDINSSIKLLYVIKEIYKSKEMVYNVFANDLIITLNKNLNNYAEVMKGYQILIDINKIVIDKVEKEEYFKHKKHVKYKRQNEECDEEESKRNNIFKKYDKKTIVNLLINENKVYQGYIDFIRNKQYDVIIKELEEIKKNNIKKLKIQIK